MSFKFSKRSLDRLKGVHPKLVEVCKMAIKTSDVDFGVTCGLRDMETQNLFCQSAGDTPGWIGGVPQI